MKSAPTFREILDLAREGREDALGDLLERYRGYLRVIAERRVHGALAKRVNASDIVQETFLDACRDFTSFRGQHEEDFGAWLNRILDHNLAEAARRHIAVAKRSALREQSMPAADDDGTIAWNEAACQQSSPSKRLMRGETAIRLAQALEELAPDQREAVRLRHLEGCTLAEISRTMGRSEVAVAGLIKRGLQALRGIVRDP